MSARILGGCFGIAISPKSEIEDISGFAFSLKFMPHTRGNIRFLKYFDVRRQTLDGVSIYVFIAYIRELFRI